MNKKRKNYRWILLIIVLVVAGMALLYFMAEEEVAEEVVPESEVSVVDSTSQQSEWKVGDGAALAQKHCTSCHSADLVTQNRMDAAGWEATIRWMQETQNLWDLGEDEDPLIEYLAKNYAPQFEGRRKPLSGVAWYEL